MLSVVGQIHGPKQCIEADFLIDTGSPVAMFLPAWVAREMGARLRKPKRVLVDAGNHPIPGWAAFGLEFEIFAAKVRVPIARAYAHDLPDDERLLGDAFLAEVGAELRIGHAVYPFAPTRKTKPNPVDEEDTDFGDMVMPRHRPRFPPLPPLTFTPCAPSRGR